MGVERGYSRLAEGWRKEKAMDGWAGMAGISSRSQTMQHEAATSNGDYSIIKI
jgi:hypothetical protein